MKKPYHSENLVFQPYPYWKVIALAWVANALGVHFKIDGIPFGAPYGKRPDWHAHHSNEAQSAAKPTRWRSLDVK